jgi:hypothetical protein
MLVYKEQIDTWVEMILDVQAWGLDLPRRHELVRCSSNGVILVWRGDQWLDDEFTAFTQRQERKIRAMCWGSTEGCPTYGGLNRVPRMRVNARFRIRGTPEEDGLWVVATYREGFVVARRILPDYRAYDSSLSIRNIPWPNQDSSSSAPTESSTTPPSSTETKTE